jgi:hypothetical protein
MQFSAFSMFSAPFSARDGSNDPGIPEDRPNRYRGRRINNAFRQLTLEPRYIVPRTEFVAHAVVYADLNKSNRAVQPFTCRIRQGNTRVGVPVTLQHEHREQEV